MMSLSEGVRDRLRKRITCHECGQPRPQYSLRAVADAINKQAGDDAISHSSLARWLNGGSDIKASNLDAIDSWLGDLELKDLHGSDYNK